MDGEVVTSAEMRQAGEHGKTLDNVLNANPQLMSQVGPIRDFLHNLAWKGAGR